MERFKLAVARGEPVNPPIWWIAPEDKTAQTIDDEFLLGDKILAAPIVQQGELLSMKCSSNSGAQRDYSTGKTSRDIYLPAGNWQDGNSGEIHNTKSGMWLRNYKAPLDILPYFIRS